jgi:two-component system sensor histidine kinase HydH
MTLSEIIDPIKQSKSSIIQDIWIHNGLQGIFQNNLYLTKYIYNTEELSVPRPGMSGKFLVYFSYVFNNYFNMNMFNFKSNAPGRSKIHMSPWMIIGISLVLMAVVVFLGVINYNRDKERMGTLLEEKGAALIRSFEAGTRTGMMGDAVNEIHLQILLEETAGQPDISYIIIVDRTGIILAHNNQDLVGDKFVDSETLRNLSPSHRPKWRIVDLGNRIKYFEVYKTFLPIISLQGDNHPIYGKEISAKNIIAPGNRSYIFIGLNISPFEIAMKEDLKHNIVMAAIVFSLGIAGIISLFWAQNHTRSSKLLEDTQKLASEVVTHLPVGILVMDMQYQIIYTNALAWNLLGTNEKAVKGVNAKVLLPNNIWSLHDMIKSGQTIAEKEITLLPEAAKPVPVAVSATNIHGEDGKYIGFMFVLKDLTEIRELVIKTQRIEKLAIVGNLAAGIAHEVRNPLSSIKGYVTYFGSLFEDNSENRKAANLMAEEVDRVNRVISELLEFARPSDLRLKEIMVRDLIDHSIRIVTHEAEAAGIQITKNIQSGLPPLTADLDRLTQVLLNLYINAIQAMPEGGSLMVQAKQKGPDLIIKISDTGKGIYPEDLKHIFDPYFTTKNKGTGLGLAIAHKIVENHNGFIQVKSLENSGMSNSGKSNSGTTISMTLPIKGEKENTP